METLFLRESDHALHYSPRCYFQAFVDGIQSYILHILPTEYLDLTSDTLWGVACKV